MRSIAEGAVALNAAMSIATAGIGAITGALGKFREIGEGIDKVGDLANATGFSTEAISGLQYAAAQTGTEVSSLEAGLKKLSVVLGQAQTAGSPAAMAIEELGLSAQFLNALGPDRAFTSIAEAISRLPTPAEKAATAVSIFGRNGIELVNMLNQGKSGLAAFHKEAESVGAVLKSNDVETVAKAFDASVEWLPGYAPDLNPVEAMWSCTKYGDLANYTPDDLYALGAEIGDSFVRQYHDTNIKRSYFQTAKLKL